MPRCGFLVPFGRTGSCGPKKDAADRQAIVESLREKLKQGVKALVGNKGYRKYLKREGKQAAFRIDEEELEEEARYDGLWVLRTNTPLSAQEAAFQQAVVDGGAGFPGGKERAGDPADLPQVR
jgi:signal transduction histidine kinase